MRAGGTIVAAGMSPNIEGRQLSGVLVDMRRHGVYAQDKLAGVEKEVKEALAKIKRRACSQRRVRSSHSA